MDGVVLEPNRSFQMKCCPPRPSPSRIWTAIGDPDVLSSDGQLDQITWFRNQNNANLNPGDFNQDGIVDVLDIDLLCAEIQADGLNDDYDLTSDGSVNRNDMNELVVNILQTTFGDANLDGVFNSSDFVAVFAFGQYEDAIDGNSTWASGDWNCDGNFTSSDLVFALQGGGYQSEAALPMPRRWALAASMDPVRRGSPTPPPRSQFAVSARVSDPAATAGSIAPLSARRGSPTPPPRASSIAPQRLSVSIAEGVRSCPYYEWLSAMDGSRPGVGWPHWDPQGHAPRSTTGRRREGRRN